MSVQSAAELPSDGRGGLTAPPIPGVPMLWATGINRAGVCSLTPRNQIGIFGRLKRRREAANWCFAIVQSGLDRSGQGEDGAIGMRVGSLFTVSTRGNQTLTGEAQPRGETFAIGV